MRVDSMPLLLDGDDESFRRSRIRSFEVILLLLLCTEHWSQILRGASEPDRFDVFAVAAITVLAALGLWGRARRLVFTACTLLAAAVIWHEFPWAGNHRYLELILCFLAAFLRLDDAGERRLLLRSLRWVMIVVLFWSGIQKLVHGYYFAGQFLAYSMWRETFEPFWRPLLEAGEYRRLSGYSGNVGAGPYRVSSLPFLVASNLAWIVELCGAILLVPRRTRRWALAGLILFLVLTEAMAREFLFGALMLNGLLLFANRDLHRRLVPLFALFFALLLLVRLGLLPEVTFH